MDYDINKILKKLVIPEPDQTARSNAIKTAVAEFKKLQVSKAPSETLVATHVAAPPETTAEVPSETLTETPVKTTSETTIETPVVVPPETTIETTAEVPPETLSETSVEEKFFNEMVKKPRRKGLLNIFNTFSGKRAVKKPPVKKTPVEKPPAKKSAVKKLSPLTSTIIISLAILAFGTYYYYSNISNTKFVLENVIMNKVVSLVVESKKQPPIIVDQNNLLNKKPDSDLKEIAETITDNKAKGSTPPQEPAKEISQLDTKGNDNELNVASSVVKSNETPDPSSSADKVVAEDSVKTNETSNNDQSVDIPPFKNVPVNEQKQEMLTNEVKDEDLKVLEEAYVKTYKSPSTPKLVANYSDKKPSEPDFMISEAVSDVKAITEHQDVGRNNFDQIISHQVKQVAEEPVSTFSIDVDTASYALVRKQLKKGQLPQKNEVKIEEMINYFDYDYKVSGERTKPFQPDILICPSPWNKNSKLLRIGIKGYEIVPEKKLLSNLVVLINVSSSMKSRNKLHLLKKSMRMLMFSLNDEDSVAIVGYSQSAETVLEPAKIKDKSKIIAALDQLHVYTSDSTANVEGIEKAYALAETSFNKNAVNRIILATDSDFNVGIHDLEKLKSFIERQRDTGIFLSIIGFGQDNYNDALMQKLAQYGNGTFSHIDNLDEGRKVLSEEARSKRFPIAKDVKIEVEFNPELIDEYRLIGYESKMLKRENLNNDNVYAGYIGSGHSVTAIYEITPVNNKTKQVDNLRSAENKNEAAATSEFNPEYGSLKMTYKLPDENQNELITTPITTDDEYNSFKETPVDLQLAASVAAFGQLLRGSIHTGSLSYKDIIQMSKPAMINDPFGQRHEFLTLVRLAMSIK